MVLATLSETAPVVFATCTAGVAFLLIGAWAARKEIAGTRGADKIVALGSLCIAIPLAVFGAEHLFGVELVVDAVPKFMPWRLFWAYFVGVALLVAALSIATKIAVRWSGLLFGIMMFLFVVMIDLRGTLAHPQNRFFWALTLREASFGAAGLILAGHAMGGWRGQGTLITIGRIVLGITAIFYGIEHFLHATSLPGVPLEKEMPAWIPGRVLIDYVTGAALLVGGGSFLLNWKTRTLATCVGGWVLLLVLVVYGPVLIDALATSKMAVQMTGINYFFDTLLFAGAILALASAMPRSIEASPERSS
jgi:uncharacterized membrane protein